MSIIDHSTVDDPLYKLGLILPVNVSPDTISLNVTVMGSYSAACKVEHY